MGAVKTFTLKMKLAKKIKQNRWGSTHVKNSKHWHFGEWMAEKTCTISCLAKPMEHI